ncbi:MAG: C4-dicarboxylate ABC transporter substrate-binding protein [Proteobacteria bacterium]|nr:C4-dicarboxylate ABC transporter substrate-binding protein [Pseudomonadota bacterium]
MTTGFVIRLFGVFAALAPILLGLRPTAADAQDQPARRAPTYAQQQDKVNAWTVGLAAGRIEGAPLRLAAEMARVVDDGDNMHVLPIVTRGPVENLNSLLYLRGVDLAIINSDVLDEYKVEFPDIGQHVSYLLNLFPSELHVFVRPEIQSLQDLAGKKVNFNTLGTAAAYSGPLIFSRLGINIDKTFIPHQLALQQMRKGENDMAAVVFVTTKPVGAFLRSQWEPGFKFLPVPYEAKFEDYFLPAVLQSSDYPALIKSGERISTIAVPTVLVSYKWPAGTNRYLRVARFTERLFGQVAKLQVAGFDPNWKTINLGATVPGLTRFPAAQEWLDRGSRTAQEKR